MVGGIIKAPLLPLFVLPAMYKARGKFAGLIRLIDADADTGRCRLRDHQVLRRTGPFSDWYHPHSCSSCN